jgi:hypothetical protein
VADAYAASALWAHQSLHASSGMSEGRKKARHAAVGTVRILWKDGAGRDRESNAALKNASANGLQVQVNEPIAAGTQVSCNDAKLGIKGNGSVRYCTCAKGRYLLGLDFPGGTGWQERSGKK